MTYYGFHKYRPTGDAIEDAKNLQHLEQEVCKTQAQGSSLKLLFFVLIILAIAAVIGK